MNEKTRYRVAIKNSKENRTELIFSDLCVHYSNGFSPVLKVKEGEEIPLSVCNEEDIRKSWLVGSLKGYLENKWIEPILDEPLKESPVPLSHFITEQMISAPGMIAPLKPLEQTKPTIEKEVLPAKPNLPEEVKDIEKTKVLIVPVEPITDLTLVKTYEDFERLSHFLKLRLIKDSDNIALLKDILGKTPSVQFKNNITLRLTQIKM